MHMYKELIYTKQTNIWYNNETLIYIYIFFFELNPIVWAQPNITMIFYVDVFSI